MRRRDVIASLGVATVWPLLAHSQQAMPVVGVLGSDSDEWPRSRYAAFRQALAEAGFAAGRTVAIEHRWADGHVARFPSLAAELVQRQVAVIAALSGIPATKAAKAATTTIPVVFQGGFDPVELGVVASMSRPGGNITGVTNLGLELGPKRLEVMHELLPTVKIFALIMNPDHPNYPAQSREMLAAARTFGVEVSIIHARTLNEFDAAFAKAIQIGAGGLIVGFGQPFTDHHGELGTLAARYRIPSISEASEFVADGGLISYSGNREDAFRLAGTYVGRILKGEKPADLPVQQATKVEMVVNMKAARALGITVPLPLLGRADEVIE